MFVLRELPRRRIFWVIGLLALTACGCARTANVSGKVTYQGRPVTYGSVIMVSADKTARSSQIEADGTYFVEGVHPGDVKIAVISRDPAKARAVVRKKKTELTGTAAAKAAAADWFALPHSFEDPEHSGLRCTLGRGNIQHDIELK